MGIARGPNLIKDNLVFGYDTGYGIADNETATRFYPGETTENLIYDMGGTVTSAYPQVVYRSTATETNVVDTSAPGGKYSRFTGIDDSSNNQLYSQFSSYSIDVRGDSVNYSVYLKGSGTCHLTIYDNQSGYGTSPTITLTSDWVRYNYTRTVSASATTYWVAVRGVLDTTDVYIAGQQATRGTHATPYVENNRSSTQSLIDLKRTTDIDVSNVSFDSIGQPESDGTDDYISIPGSSKSAFGQNGSLEVIVKPTNSTGNDRLWCTVNNSSSIDAYLNGSSYNVYMHGGVVGTTTPLTQNKHNHVVATYINGTVQIYINGTAGVMTGTTTGYNITNSSSALKIGAFSNGGYNLHGRIPTFKLYSKGLTAEEVKQNYNAYKNRFNI